jgi:hypothetical protein
MPHKSRVNEIQSPPTGLNHPHWSSMASLRLPALTKLQGLPYLFRHSLVIAFSSHNLQAFFSEFKYDIFFRRMLFDHKLLLHFIHLLFLPGWARPAICLMGIPLLRPVPWRARNICILNTIKSGRANNCFRTSGIFVPVNRLLRIFCLSIPDNSPGQFAYLFPPSARLSFRNKPLF